jgi:hypothetical protein
MITQLDTLTFTALERLVEDILDGKPKPEPEEVTRRVLPKTERVRKILEGKSAQSIQSLGRAISVYLDVLVEVTQADRARRAALSGTTRLRLSLAWYLNHGILVWVEAGDDTPPETQSLPGGLRQILKSSNCIYATSNLDAKSDELADAAAAYAECMALSLWDGRNCNAESGP